MMKKRMVGIALAALAAAVVGVRHARQDGSRPQTAAMTTAVSEGVLEETVEASGSVTPLNRVEINPPIAGRIDQILVAEGDAVNEGQVLAWMSSSDRAAILDAAKALGPEELERWRKAYKPTPIVAPLAGIVILRNAVPGQTVQGATVLFAISDELIVKAQVDETDIGRLREGMTARIVLDAYPGLSVDGKVFDVLHEGTNVSNVITYGVKVRPDRVPAQFRSQMTATVRFIVQRKDLALHVPVAAIREARGGGKSVLVPGTDGLAVERGIVTGMASGDRVEVVSGLAAGERIIVAAGEYFPQKGQQSSPLAMRGPRAPKASGARR